MGRQGGMAIKESSLSLDKDIPKRNLLWIVAFLAEEVLYPRNIQYEILPMAGTHTLPGGACVVHTLFGVTETLADCYYH